jgi:predicted Zn-ribbon and HTH transcriptional regulator
LVKVPTRRAGLGGSKPVTASQAVVPISPWVFHNVASTYHMPTTRQQMILLLSEGNCTARDLSQTLGVREKEVYAHLAHIARSVVPKGQRLLTISSRCLSCGYVFDTRKRFTKPGRCPKCKSERIEEPRYRII